MRDRLFIRLKADQESVEWGLINSQDSTADFLDRGSLLVADIVALAEMAQSNPVTMIIPSEKVRSFKVDPPTKNRKHLEKAVPFLLEEQVIESVESQHFALGDFDSDALLSVNVVSKKFLTDLLATLKDAGIEPDELLADAACLPVFDDAWTMLDSEPVLVRQDKDTFWSAPQSMTKELLSWNLSNVFEEEQSLTQAMRVFSAKDKTLNIESVAGLALQPMPIDDELLWLASQDTDAGINLLQQSYTPTKKSSSDLSQWKLPMMAASFFLVAALVYLISDIFILKSERDAYRQQALMEVQKISPNITEERLDSKIYEISNTYRKASGGNGKVSGFVTLLDKVYSQINPQQVKLEQMDYNSTQGNLNLDVRATDYQQLTSTQQALEKSGLNVEMRNARDNDGSWTTRLVVKVN